MFNCISDFLSKLLSKKCVVELIPGPTTSLIHVNEGYLATLSVGLGMR